MKKISILFALVFVLGLFGCTPAEDSNNGDQDLKDNPVNDSNVDDPVIPDIVVSNEKYKLADLYVAKLYDRVIISYDPASERDWFHSDSLIDHSAFTLNDIKGLAYRIDRNTHVYDGGDYSFCYRIDDMIATVAEIFGPGIEITTDEWGSSGLAFVYDERQRRFCGEPVSGGDSPIKKIFGYFGKYELDGDYLYIYDRVLFCEHDRRDTGIIKFYSDINKTEESYVNEFQVGDYLPSDFSNDEALEQYGAEYKHTFKLTDDGSYYYWVSSEPVK